jgi:hypothetical protein
MGIEDVAGKYYEAVVKLADWYNDGQQHQLTSALSTLVKSMPQRATIRVYQP